MNGTRGRPVTELDDTELERQGTQAHATRNWVFLHGTAEQFDQHTHRMLALEQEYLRRYPHRTWQGTPHTPAPDPLRAVLGAVEEAGGRMHKLAVHQAARAAGLDRAALARLYARGLLRTEAAERVLTDAGRQRLSGSDAPAGLRWVAQENPTWDPAKAAIIDDELAPEHTGDATLPGEWWAAQDGDGRVLGYGWMDVGWGEAKVLLAVAPDARGTGVGSWVLSRLEGEAAARGLNYVYNAVRAPEGEQEAVRAWLVARGYSGEESLRKRVGRPEAAVPEGAGRNDEAAGDGRQGLTDENAGDEAQGGYVDAADHHY